MQTLVFNTTEKKVKLYSGFREDSVITERFDNISTVKATEFGFYEVFQKNSEQTIPVMRLPIAHTNIIYEK